MQLKRPRNSVSLYVTGLYSNSSLKFKFKVSSSLKARVQNDIYAAGRKYSYITVLIMIVYLRGKTKIDILAA